MKYTRLIILTGVVLLVFIGAIVAYSQLSGNLAANNTVEVTASTTKADVTAATDQTKADTSSSADPQQTTAADPKETTAAVVSAKEGIEIGNLAYDFTLTNYAGEDVTLSGLRGKIVVLNFWASWCGPCQNEMPEFQIMQDAFTAQGAKADTVFLTVNLADGQRETRDTAQAFLDEKGYTFPAVFDAGSVANLYQIYSIPTTFVLDKNGVITEMFLGSTNQKDLEKAIEAAKS